MVKAYFAPVLTLPLTISLHLLPLQCPGVYETGVLEADDLHHLRAISFLVPFFCLGASVEVSEVTYY